MDEVAEQTATGSQAHEPRFHRRTLLKSIGVTGTAAVAPVTVGANRKRSTPRVVIVGGGLAGIRCAHKLWTQRKLASTIYEWDDPLGGRAHTIRGAFANGQIVEACGQFISSEHQSMLGLAKQFGLTLVNTDAYAPGTVSTFWVNGGRYT